MKQFTAVLLAVSMIVTLVTGSLMSADAYSDDSSIVGTKDENYAAINSITIQDAGMGKTLCDGGSAEMERVSETLFRYTFKDLNPGSSYRFRFFVNGDHNDCFGREADPTDYGLDVPIRVFRYPYGNYPISNEFNLTEQNLTLPPEGYSYDVTISLDLSNYDENNPDDPNGYAEYTVSAQRSYHIRNAFDWDIFCNRISDKETYNHFLNETVYLDDNIAVRQQAGSDTHDFCGSFDGQGHMLTFNYKGSDDYIAPFPYCSNDRSVGDEPVTFKNLVVKSTIMSSGTHASGLIGQCRGIVKIENCRMNMDIDTTNEYAAGYVGSFKKGKLDIIGCSVEGAIYTSAKFAAGFVSETNASCNLTDCLSSVTIDSSVIGDGTHGGFVGVQTNHFGSAVMIEGCAFNGSLLGNRTNSCGGFVGWHNNSVYFRNSIFAPASVTVGNKNSAMFAHGDATAFNCYYLYAFGTDSDNQCTQGYAVTAGENTTVNPGGGVTRYKTSNINTSGKGIQFNDVVYAGAGENISLTLLSTPPEGMMLSGYSVNRGILTGTENPYKLSMIAKSIVVTANFVEKPRKVGDVNLDGEITILDATVIQQYIAELIEMDENRLALANTNGDETIDISDATYLQMYIAEVVPRLAEPAPTTEPDIDHPGA